MCWRPTSWNAHAARISRCPRLAELGLSRAAWTSASACPAIAPRRKARSAAASRPAATFSSGPRLACARCQTWRSGTPTSTCARARCMACRPARPAASHTADRISGCRNRTLDPSTSASPAATASARSATDTCASDARLAAASTSGSESPSFSPAASNAVRVGAGRPGRRHANACSRRLVSGIHLFRTPSLPCWLADAGSSTRASGFPAAASRTPWRTAGSSTACASSNAAAASGSSGPSRSSASPAPASGLSYSSAPRAVPIRPIRSAPSRRLTNDSTSHVAESNQCTSSATTRTGACPASAASSSRVARPTSGIAGPSPSPTPRAVSSASRWPRGSPSASASIGRSSWCKPAKEKCASPGIPAQVSTSIPRSAPDRLALATSADFPIPGSPRTSNDRPPSAIWVSRNSTSATSESRPISSGVIIGRHPKRPSPQSERRPWPERPCGMRRVESPAEPIPEEAGSVVSRQGATIARSIDEVRLPL